MSLIDRANQFPRGLSFNGEAFDGTTTVNPSLVGVVAPIGSKLRNTVSGTHWRKIGALDTDWVPSNADQQGFEFNSILIWNVNGNFQTGVEQDGIRFPQGAGTIERVSMYTADRGGAGNTVVDIKKHSAVGVDDPGDIGFGIAGTTIYTTTANRPTIAGDNGNKTQNALLYALNPDILAFDADTFYSMDIVSVTNANRDLTVALFVRHN